MSEVALKRKQMSKSDVSNTTHADGHASDSDSTPSKKKNDSQAEASRKNAPVATEMDSKLEQALKEYTVVSSTDPMAKLEPRYMPKSAKTITLRVCNACAKLIGVVDTSAKRHPLQIYEIPLCNACVSLNRTTSCAYFFNIVLKNASGYKFPLSPKMQGFVSGFNPVSETDPKAAMLSAEMPMAQQTITLYVCDDCAKLECFAGSNGEHQTLCIPLCHSCVKYNRISTVAHFKMLVTKNFYDAQ